MKLKLVISGGQTGADRTALVCAKELGLATGGTAPKGYRTETGDDPTLKTLFGLVEDLSSSYPPRTKLNVKNANITLWFGNVNSPGYWSTWNAAKSLHRPFVENPTSLVELADLHEVINFAGNRLSSNPNVVNLVRAAFHTIRPNRSSDVSMLEL